MNLKDKDGTTKMYIPVQPRYFNVNWMLDKVKSNKCFIIPRKIGSNKLVVWKRLVSTKGTLT